MSKITCSVLSCFVTTRIAAVLETVGEPKVRFLVIALVLPIFHQIDPPGENIKHHLRIDRKNKWPSVESKIVFYVKIKPYRANRKISKR